MYGSSESVAGALILFGMSTKSEVCHWNGESHGSSSTVALLKN